MNVENLTPAKNAVKIIMSSLQKLAATQYSNASM
jgi:hypothetical protein